MNEKAGKVDTTLSPMRKQEDVEAIIKKMPPTDHDHYPNKVVDAYHSIGRQGWFHITKQLFNPEDTTIHDKIDKINKEKRIKREQELLRKKSL